MRAGKSILYFLIILFFLASNSNPQTSGIKKYHPLSGRLGLSLEGGTTFTLSDFSNPGWSYDGRFSAEYLFPSTQVGVWGLKGLLAAGFLEGTGGATSTRPDVEAFKTTFFSVGGGVEYILAVSDVVLPYAYAGAAYLYFDPNDPNGNPLLRNQQKKYSKNEWMLVGEGGFKFLVSENVSLNLGLNINYINMDNLDDVVIGTDNDIFFNAFGGLTIFFGGTKDSDGDGVADDADLCPDTPYGVLVDNFGCPVDTDRDGVPDYLDMCINTPANLPVDTNGCLVDSDNDGVPDYLDLCRATPEGVVVDKRGCAFDEDEDGVPDYRDICPGTPMGIEVNHWGCPLEEHSKELPDITAMMLCSGVNFEVGKATLLSGAKLQLNIMIEVMDKHSEARWRIDGYTDNTGSYSTNMKLSYERAQSVANFLVQNGIDRTRLDVRGLGPDYPIADNSTESGRALNRRVSIEYIEEGLEPIEMSTYTGYDVQREKHVGNMIFTDGNLYCFQVSSFRSRSQAEKDAQRLREIGEKVFIVEANLPQLDGIWYRVRIGYFNTLSEARERRKSIVR